MALVALSALLSWLEGAGSVTDAAAPRAVEGTPKLLSSIPLPVLPGMAELAPAITELVWGLNRLGTRREGAILASMYRHLAYWPAYLALAWTLIAPLDADGSLDRAIADASKKARMRADRVAARLRTPIRLLDRSGACRCDPNRDRAICR
jgi:hypothetical protein